ncbi:Conserved_hypothetical protein [Hexamita inflata]|uniref:Uncharacterized protein n=1 Tax=Hexamita inflata TaxID=28002 RepID=A0AA86NUJ5_9EUKA|nr:Conserved hypothetical protein [Hexamita inflata]
MLEQLTEPLIELEFNVYDEDLAKIFHQVLQKAMSLTIVKYSSQNQPLFQDRPLNLKVINISSMRLDDVQIGNLISSSINTLEYLKLEQCSIRAFNVATLQQLVTAPNIHTINFNQNKLTYQVVFDIFEQIIQYKPAKLKTLSLAFNPLFKAVIARSFDDQYQQLQKLDDQLCKNQVFTYNKITKQLAPSNYLELDISETQFNSDKQSDYKHYFGKTLQVLQKYFNLHVKMGGFVYSSITDTVYGLNAGGILTQFIHLEEFYDSQPNNIIRTDEEKKSKDDARILPNSKLYLDFTSSQLRKLTQFDKENLDWAWKHGSNIANRLVSLNLSNTDLGYSWPEDTRKHFFEMLKNCSQLEELIVYNEYEKNMSQMFMNHLADPQFLPKLLYLVVDLLCNANDVLEAIFDRKKSFTCLSLNNSQTKIRYFQDVANMLLDQDFDKIMIRNTCLCRKNHQFVEDDCFIQDRDITIQQKQMETQILCLQHSLSASCFSSCFNLSDVQNFNIIQDQITCPEHNVDLRLSTMAQVSILESQCEMIKQFRRAPLYYMLNNQLPLQKLWNVKLLNMSCNKFNTEDVSILIQIVTEIQFCTCLQLEDCGLNDQQCASLVNVFFNKPRKLLNVSHNSAYEKSYSAVASVPSSESQRFLMLNHGRKLSMTQQKAIVQQLKNTSITNLVLTTSLEQKFIDEELGESESFSFKLMSQNSRVMNQIKFDFLQQQCELADVTREIAFDTKISYEDSLTYDIQ